MRSGRGMIFYDNSKIVMRVEAPSVRNSSMMGGDRIWDIG